MNKRDKQDAIRSEIQDDEARRNPKLESLTPYEDSQMDWNWMSPEDEADAELLRRNGPTPPDPNDICF
jgi:hypothetical protein